ncbi:MAG TPA: hypothetical protein PLB95_07080 [Syntrophales bacterium]|nr:hypothetical protein [Syntrophales bacterium]HQK78897.1 hypothetical protein [Syntrophales bacterium]
MQAIIRLAAAAEGITVHNGYEDVTDNEVRRRLAGDLQGVGAVFRLHDLKTMRFQQVESSK